MTGAYLQRASAGVYIVTGGIRRSPRDASGAGTGIGQQTMCAAPPGPGGVTINTQRMPNEAQITFTDHGRGHAVVHRRIQRDETRGGDTALPPSLRRPCHGRMVAIEGEVVLHTPDTGKQEMKRGFTALRKARPRLPLQRSAVEHPFVAPLNRLYRDAAANRKKHVISDRHIQWQRTDSTEDREGQIARACMKDVEAEERQCEGELRLSRSRSPRQAPAVKSPYTSRRVPRVESEERSSGGGVACMSRHSKAREGYEPNAGVEALMQEVSHPDEGDPPQTAGKGVSPGPENESAAKARDPGLVADETESALDRQSLSAPPTTVAEAAAFQDHRSSAKSGTVCERTASVRDLHDQRKAEQQDLRDMNRAFGGVGRGPHERRALAPGAPCAMRSDEGDPSGSAVEAHCTRGSESLREKMGHNRRVFRDDAVLRGLNMRDAQRATTELLGRGRPPFPVGRLYDATSRPRAFSGQLRQGYQDGGGGVPSPGSLARPPPFLPQRPHTVVRSNATCTLARGHEVAGKSQGGGMTCMNKLLMSRRRAGDALTYT
ncbi:hypothetical protein BESB_001320 [Besnoitia besnoiti]|uniref:Uncharacterized protein n=1 Tax=Besnoitia besnoiti TaxID=94643 RepID=A0A2A9MPL4_BESBE|nr:hypothetical protein BESB_001320 [Besnoitia besnoiti]PFH37790.1 hypothetical protein BESB_001320 [Besnoitia besnoiti]